MKGVIVMDNPKDKAPEMVRDSSQKQNLLQAMRIGIVKQLYQDKLITANQYQFLLQKYGYSG
jgi:hypothetical protein